MLAPVLAAALTLPQALDVARASGTLVFADFEAPWCYSCYYMEQKVLSQPAFQRASEGLVLAKIDVDTPEGRKLKEKHAVTFLPSYLLLDAAGREKGRLVGEQQEEEFLAKLSQLRAESGDRVEQALVEVRSLVAAKRYAEAEKLIASLPEERSKALSFRPEWTVLTRRVALMRLIERKKSAGAEPVRLLLEAEKGCELAYDVLYAEDYMDSLYPESRQALLRQAQGALERLAEEGRCADARTVTDMLASVYQKLDEPAKRAALLSATVARLEKAAKVGEDRNRDDNLRYFLEQAGEDAKLRAFYEELVKAYPQDYVYSFRYARYLLEKGEAEAALPWAEKADRLSYGANRLGVTKVRAQALAKLGKLAEAKALLKRDIKAGRSAFAKEAKALQELLTSLK